MLPVVRFAVGLRRLVWTSIRTPLRQRRMVGLLITAARSHTTRRVTAGRRVGGANGGSSPVARGQPAEDACVDYDTARGIQRAPFVRKKAVELAVAPEPAPLRQSVSSRAVARAR